MTYIFLFCYLAYIKYYTFHDTFADLGVYNQQLWLLSHGGIGLLNSSHFNTEIYNLQYQEGIFFVVWALYLIRPDITTLLFIESIALGLTAIPVFYLARRKIGSTWIAAAVALGVLVYFPLASGNLVDFHLENLTPLLFISMALAWHAGWRRTGFVFSALTAIVNPLTLVIVVFFYVAKGIPVDADGRPELKNLQRVVRSFFADRASVAFTAGLVALFILYRLLGTLPVAGVGTGGSGLGFGGTVFFAINSKLALILLLLGAVAFLPLFDWFATFVLLPYIGFILFSVDSANWIQFGLMYTNMAVGPVFLGVINALARYERRVAVPLEHPSGFLPSAGPAAGSRRWRTTSPAQGPFNAFLLMTAVFAVLYFPVSPVNEFIQGGYFSGNHDLKGITTVTPQVAFLWRAIGLVPPGGAVLTQNNIPQLTGRVYYQTGPGVKPDIPYDYILMDGAIEYFSSASDLVPIIAPALANGSFGVLAEGQGALLLKKGYTGAPALYDPQVENYTGSQLADFSGVTQGTTLAGSGPSFSLWYGPSATLFPGSYSVTYSISVSTITPAARQVISIDTVSSGGSVVYASQSIYTSNFTAPEVPVLFTLHFSLSNVVSGIEYRGMMPTGAAVVTLHYISIMQTALLA